MTRLTSSQQRQTDTRPVQHEHGWTVESRHATSDGDVIYVRCADCGARRVDLQVRPGSVPAAQSVQLPSDRSW